MVLHFGCWLLSSVDTWLTLWLIGVPRAAGAALVIDSLLYGLRSIAFLIPNAVGVQEAGYVLFGSLFGITPGVALAVSLIRRTRDLIVNVPALLVWQALEGRRVLHRRKTRRQAGRRHLIHPRVKRSGTPIGAGSQTPPPPARPRARARRTSRADTKAGGCQ